MEKKFKLASIKTNFIGHTLYRIEALKSFGDVKKGDVGGFVEIEGNLSQHGTSWIYDNAKVTGDAVVCGNAKVYDNAKIFNQALVRGNVVVFGTVKIGGNADLHGYEQVKGDAVIMSDKDYVVFKNFWSSGRYFTWTRSNNMWSAGCFYGTGEELVVKAHKDSEESGREYGRVVRYAESILEDEEKQKQSNQETPAIPCDWEVMGAVQPIKSMPNKINLKKAFRKLQKMKGQINISIKRHPDANLIKGYWELIKAWRNK